jgi:hypothetical protein
MDARAFAAPATSRVRQRVPGWALKNFALAMLQFLQSGDRRGIWNADVKRKATAIHDLPIEHTDGIGRRYPDGRKYPFGFLFDGRFYASIDGSCFCYGDHSSALRPM